MRRQLLLLAALVPLLAGCVNPFGAGDEPAWPPVRPSPSPGDTGPPLVWGGTVVDALDGRGVPEATVRLDLSQVQPCRRPGIGWSSASPPVQEDGSFGPFETARPASDDFAFFLNVQAPGYSPNTTFIGAVEARGDIGHITVVLHREASVEGSAPPGTVLALEAPDFPRFAVADDEGRFMFAQARVVPAMLVAAVDVPHRETVTAPAVFLAEHSGGASWRLEGIVRTPEGRPLVADIIARNGTQLWSAARSDETGTFVMPLSPERVQLTLEARTSDGRWGAVRAFELMGPPALRETLLARALC